MYVDRYDKCLNEVAEICKPMKETLAKCLDLENDYNIDKYTIYKEMVEMELFNYFCELMEKKMLLPSKELLSEVLGFEVKDIVLSTRKNLCFFNCNVEERINIYELAFLIRDYFHKKYKHDLDMSLEINEIFKNATQFYESVL